MKKHFHLILFLFLTLLIGCNKQQTIDKIQLQGAVFGTTYSIIYLNDDTNYQKEINSLFDEINTSLSTYSATSDISKINKGNTSIIVDDYFLEVFKKSKKIFAETNGYFDPTVGGLVNAYGFGPEHEIEEFTSNKLDSLMHFVGLNKVKIVDRIVVKETPEIYLDFNSIAKGYAVDVIANFLEQKKLKNYLVEIGGEIRAKGTNDKQNPWRIGIDDPNEDDTRTITRLIDLSNESIASSGNYRKFKIDADGNKFVHTINPKTGLARESNLLAATVIGKMDCADADGYATAFMAMGLEKTKKFVEENDSVKVILFYLNSEGKIEEFSNYNED
jgi:thiamine biosynthesis lipoprotein